MKIWDHVEGCDTRPCEAEVSVHVRSGHDVQSQHQVTYNAFIIRIISRDSLNSFR